MKVVDLLNKGFRFMPYKPLLDSVLDKRVHLEQEESTKLGAIHLYQ